MAVFTPVRFEEAAAFLTAYAVGDLTRLDAISEGVENTNYRVEAGGRTYVLTLYEKRVRPEDLPFFLALTTHLADAGYPAPRPIPQQDGATLGTLNGRPAALIAWKPGRWKREPERQHFETAGARLAQLHVLAAQRPDDPSAPPNRFALAAWRDLLTRCQAAAEAAEWSSMLATLAAEITLFDAAWPTDLPTGVIHGDYFPDNILFTDDAITGVIDYYFAGRDAFAYDLAIAINAWCFDAAGRLRPADAAAFCRGYDRVRPLSTAERAALPLLCRGAAVRFTLSRLHDVLHHNPAWLVTPKDPAPFFARLACHRAAADAGVYGLAVAG